MFDIGKDLAHAYDDGFSDGYRSALCKEHKVDTEVIADEVQFLEWGDTDNQDAPTGFTPVDNNDLPFKGGENK